MDVTRLNRLHWIAISLLVGVVLAFLWRDQDATLLGNDASRDMSLDVFVRSLNAKDRNGKPILVDLAVHPTMQTALGPANRVTGYKAAMESRVNFFGFGGGPGREELPIGEFHFVALRPFKVGSHSYTDVTEYLKMRQQRDSKIAFGYSYSSVPAVRMWFIIVTSFLVIGGVWPTIVGVLTGQGPWLMPKMGGEGWSVGGASTATVATKSLAETDAEKAAALRQVQSMNESLEQGLGGMAMTPGAPGQAGAAGPAAKLGGAAGAGGVRVLTGEAPAAAPTPAQEQEAKEFRGEFYPVAKPLHHEEGEEKK